MSVVHEHLGRTVLNVSDQVLFLLMAGESLSRTEELRAPEVANSNVTIVANEHVIWFNVVVDNTQRMERAQPRGLERGKRVNVAVMRYAQVLPPPTSSYSLLTGLPKH